MTNSCAENVAIREQKCRATSPSVLSCPVQIKLRIRLIVIIVLFVPKRSQSVRECESTNVPPLLDPVHHGRAEVDTGVNAGLAVFSGCLGKAVIRACDAGERAAAGGGKWHAIAMEKPTQYFGGGSAEDAMGGSVVGN